MRNTLLRHCPELAVAAPAAQQTHIEFNDGRVTVDATSVPVRTILTEWAKGRHQGGRRRARHRRAADHQVDRRSRSAGARGHPSQRGRLYGRAARHRGRLDVRPHSGDGDQLHAASLGRGARRRSRIRTLGRTQRFVPPQRAAEPRTGRTRTTIRLRRTPPVFTFPRRGRAGAAGAVPATGCTMQNNGSSTAFQGQPAVIVTQAQHGRRRSRSTPRRRRRRLPTGAPWASPTPGVIPVPARPRPTPGSHTSGRRRPAASNALTANLAPALAALMINCAPRGSPWRTSNAFTPTIDEASNSSIAARLATQAAERLRLRGTGHGATRPTEASRHLAWSAKDRP